MKSLMDYFMDIISVSSILRKRPGISYRICINFLFFFKTKPVEFLRNLHLCSHLKMYMYTHACMFVYVCLYTFMCMCLYTHNVYKHILTKAPRTKQMDNMKLASSLFLIANFTLLISLVPCFVMGFPGGLAVKNPPATQGTWVQSLGWVDPLEKGMAIHSSILA